MTAKEEAECRQMGTEIKDGVSETMKKNMSLNSADPIEFLSDCEQIVEYHSDNSQAQ